MPVRNPAKSEGRQTPYTPNQVPTTERGKRRSQKTEEYLQNLERRKKQTYGHRRRGRR